MTTPTSSSPSSLAALSALPLSPTLLSHLTSLHTQSLNQESSIPASITSSIRARYASDPEGAKSALDDLMRDKFIALDADKCVFIYSLLLAINAKTVVEVGTSFGVSTIYLALAVNENVRRSAKGGGDHAQGKVIATEKEASKIAVAKENWKNADPDGTLRLEEAIEVREGDLEETLKGEIEGEVDFVLLDIWPYVALPALKLLLPKMRPGAVVMTDNTVQSAVGYRDLFGVLRDPSGDFRSVTLPYSGGLEMSVYWPKTS